MIQTDYEKRSGSEIQCEVNELDNIKVGNRIVYNGKNCTICKILVRNGSSRFLVRYDNEVLDYVPNDKSRYRIASSHIPSHNMAPEKGNRPRYQLSTSLEYLVKQNIITHKQLHQCHKKKLRTIGDVKKIIEKYNLNLYSTRFTKYTLDMWFGIIRLLDNKN